MTDQGFQPLPDAYQSGGEEWPTLYKRTSTGAIQEWRIGVVAVAGDEPGQMFGEIHTLHGQVGGKTQEAIDLVREGKNIGRANATGPVDQARAEAKAKWEKQLKKGYVESIEAAEAGETHDVIQGGVSPMLAHKYDDHGHKIKYPALAQPKLDGHRCVAVVRNGECTLWSRTRKRIESVPHVVDAIERAFSGHDVVLDGELYNHAYRDNFEELTSYIRSATPKPGHQAVQYWIYDVISDDPQEDRIALLSEDETGMGVALSMLSGGPLVLVPTDEVEDEEEMVRVFGAYVANGFEGLMLRNRQARYKNGRSYDLQKVKTMQDAEYEVVGVQEGRGKMAGLAIFECRTDEGKTFTVKMKGELESLRKYANDPSLAVGRMLTVQFQNLTADGVPRFPVGLRFREDV